MCFNSLTKTDGEEISLNKRKRRIANIIMVAVILLVAAAGLFAVGSVRGWFGGRQDAATLCDVRGVVNLTRGGVAYPVEEETALRAGDALACDTGATALIRLNDGTLSLGGGAEVEILSPEAGAFRAEVASGEVFVNARGALELDFVEKEIAFEDAAALLSVRGSAQTLTVLDGSVADTPAGQAVYWVGRDESTGEVNVQALNDFAIAQIRAANQTRALCVTDAELDALVQARSAAIGAQLVSDSGDGLTCTIAIYCDTILNNWDSLDTAKASYVPDDGVILAPTQVSFEVGETVFDVLKRVCDACDIQIEYSWTPMYDSYYIEGIHQLYEFDCGPQSGWMYKVNEWFPNYGCSEYKLTGGESIVWCYTCVGLGEDVGGGSF